MLDSLIAVDDETVHAFRRDGHVTVREVATPDELAGATAAIERAVEAHQAAVPPIDARDTYGQAFLQVADLWRRDEAIHALVTAPRFAKLAADLMGVEGVRLYHDQALAKEPGGGHTPWHQDQVYWPLATDETVTMWLALVDVPEAAGPMTFASGSHRFRDLGPRLIGDESERAYAELVRDEGLEERSAGALRAGDATFHRGWTLHRAPANHTERLRLAMTVIYFADGTRVGAPDHPAREFDRQVWLGGAEPGAPAAGASNPRLWPPEAPPWRS